MKKSNRLSRTNSTARRSRLHQMYSRSVRARRMARQKVFFLQEKDSQ
ncbi:MAG: hypothetical protein ACI4NE_07440 [Succinivibrio sp.]